MQNEQLEKPDAIAYTLRTYAQNILVVIFGLLPLIFIPTAVAPFEYTKVLVVVAGALIALVLYSLSVLRTGTVRIGLSLPLCALWGVAGIAFISSLLSGDFRDSLVGDFFSIHSTIFVAVLALIPTVWVVLQAEKTSVIKMYLLLAGSTLVLSVFHILRLIFGAEFLSFGIFTGNVSTPVGTWNDLALFLGLSVILSLVVLEQLSLSRMGRSIFVVVSVMALILLSVINFFTVWLILGLSSLVMVVYTLGKDRFSGSQLSLIQTKSTNTTSLFVALGVFAVSVLFVVGGSSLGGWIAKYTGVSYVEVRPSLEATSNIARHVYAENAFLGIGANKFSDAWRLYKEESINTTPFWNTDFNAGNGYITTFFVTTGVLGGVAWILFLVLYVVTGVRRLLGVTACDKHWFFIAVSSFVSALYIWGMSLVYVPGVVILLLGALCTGVSLHAFTMLSGKEPKVVTVGTNRRTGFVLTMVVITIIVGSVSVLYVAGRHYSSIYTFNDSIRLMQEGKPITELEQEVLGAYALSSSDVYARRIAEYQLARLNSLVGITEPTETQIQEFNDASVNGIRFGQEAVRIDALEPANWAVLGGIYNVLASMGMEGADDRVREALTKSQELNPQNPLPYLELAIVEARGGNIDLARSYIAKSIALKQNFTEAFYLLSQLEVAQGNVDAAIQSTLSVIALEPQNPVRYYQLGVLYISKKDLTSAISAFEKSVALDTNYANARYLLGLAYDETGKSAEAREQLQKVLDLNPGNAEVSELIGVIDSEGSLARLRSQVSGMVSEAAPTTSDAGNVSTTEETETSLVTPVNTPPKDVEVTETITQ